MKKSSILKMFSLVAFAMAGALGVAAGKETKKTESVKAATTETTFYVDASSSMWGGSLSETRVYLFNDTNETHTAIWPSGATWSAGADDNKGGLSVIEIGGKTYYSFTLTGRDYEGGVIYAWNMNGKGNQSDNFYFNNASTTDNCLTVTGTSAGWEGKNSIAWSHIDVGATVTVTKYGIIGTDTSTKWKIDDEEVESGGTYSVPGRLNHEGYHFNGWFLDDFETAYTAQTVDSDLDIYAVYTALSEDKYIYYVDDSETSNWIKSWDGDEQFGVGDGSMGSAITSVSTEVHGVLNFQGSTKYIYKIKVSSESGDGHFKFHPNSGWEGESDEKVLTIGAAYWYVGPVNVNAGLALDFLLKAEQFRNAASHDGINYSVCGISQSDAQDLVDEYDTLKALEGNICETYIDCTTTYTYNPEKSAAEQKAGASYDQVQVSYAAIVAKLREIAGGTEPHLFQQSPFLTGIFSNGNSTIIILIAVALVSMTGIGMCLVIRRKKAE